LLSTATADAAPPCPLVYKVGKEIELPAGVKAAKRIPPPKLPRRAVGKRAPTGDQKVVVILVNFKDRTITEPTSYYHDLIFGTDTGKMNNYYQTVSAGKVSLSSGTAAVVITTSTQNMAYYGTDGNDIDGDGENDIDSGQAGNPTPIWNLAKEAVEIADAQVDFSDYDSDGDGIVDHVIIVHAGSAQEYTLQSTDINSHRWHIGGDIGGSTCPVDGVAVDNYAMVAEDSPMGTFAHEFGHELGLPDLYDTETGKPSTDKPSPGKWELMDAGMWNGNPPGTNPAHPSAWCKTYLGWINPTVVRDNNEYTLNSQESDSPSVLKIPINSSDNPSSEYFLVSYRRKTGYDGDLPGEGILIWHVDDSVGSIEENNINYASYDHLRVAGEASDGSWSGTDKEDAWTSLSPPFQSPQSDACNKLPSGVAILNFKGEGLPQMELAISYAASDTTPGIVELTPYPNPNRQSDITISIVFRRPVKEKSIRIFTVAGDLVHTAPSTEITFKPERTDDYRWEYSYVWNRNNDAGNSVAPGVYVVLASGDNAHKTGKIVLLP